MKRIIQIFTILIILILPIMMNACASPVMPTVAIARPSQELDYDGYVFRPYVMSDMGDLYPFTRQSGDDAPELFRNFNAHNPTMEEIGQFLEDDKSEKMKGSDICLIVASNLYNEAQEQEFICYLVMVKLDIGGHVLNGFWTDEGNLVLVDCSAWKNHDCQIMNLEIGSDYRCRDVRTGKYKTIGKIVEIAGFW